MRSVYQVLGFDVLSKAFLGFAGVALIRFMQPAEYARLTYGLAVVAFAAQALAFAFNRTYVVSQVRITRIRIEGMISAQVLLVLVFAVVLAPAIRVLGALYVPVVALVLASALTDFTKTMYQRDQLFMRLSLVELGRSVLYVSVLAALFLVNRMWLQARWVLSAQIVCMGAVIVGSWRVERRPAPRLSVHRGVGVLREMGTGASRFLLLYFLLLSLFGQLETLLLGRLSTSLALASYGAASRYYGLLSLALGAVHTVLLPVVHEARQEGTLDHVLREQRRMSLVVVPLLIFAGGVAGWALPMIDGGKYPASVMAFRVLVASAAFSFILSPYSNVLISALRYPLLCGLVLISTIVGGTVSILTIPHYGAIGAAFGQTGGFFVLNLLTYWAARKEMRSIPEQPAA